VSPATLTTTRPRPNRMDDSAGSDGVLEQADRLLTAMASIRRSGRLLAHRPVELATLTGSQIDLVSLVLRRPGVSVAQAAEELRLAPNTVSTLVRQLTDARLLIRRVDPQDRRVARLDLTPAMRRKVGAFRDRRAAMLGAAMSRLAVCDQRRLAESLAILDQLAEQLEVQGDVDG
jgi:DNA-binding MarR family transcriptional regulator